MLNSATDINAALKQIPCIGDADTGYGNAVNVKRTVTAYAQAGMAGIMLEDQVSPKRCGHTSGKAVVSREEAYQRIQAAVDARKEGNFDIVIVARTDARGPHSLEEAIERCKEFVRIGADVTFLDAPRSIEDMREYCKQVPGPKMITLIERGPNPIASPAQLAELGYKLATYPATLLNVGIKAMEQSLELLKQQAPETQQDGSNASPDAALDAMLCDFEHVKDVVGFTEYNAEEARYSSKK